MIRYFAVRLLSIFVAMLTHLALPAFAQVAASPAPTPTAIPAATQPGYLVVIGRTLDRPKLMNYSAALPSIYAETGGRYIGIGRAGGGAMCLYGLCEGRSVVIARWADQRSIEAFWWGENYRKAVRLRDNAGVFTVVGLRGHADVAPFESGALLLATLSDTAVSPKVDVWLAAATKAGGRSLAPMVAEAVRPLEGDALYRRVALISFESKEKREAFVASEANQIMLKAAQQVSLLSMMAIDAPLAR